MSQYDNLPKTLIEKAHFCCWRFEYRGDPKPTKVPYNPSTGRKASTKDPKTFCSFKNALQAIENYHGLGFRIADDLGALDLDSCFEETGELKPWARDIVEIFSGCYIERSPSGKGLRIMFQCPGYIYDKKKYYINNRNLGLEVYISGATNRFVTVTGDMFREGDILDTSRRLDAFLNKYMLRPAAAKPKKQYQVSHSHLPDEAIIAKASNSVDGAKFSALWNGDISGYASQSEADLAFSAKLAFWCNGDIEQMDRLFRESGLMRDKWDRPQSGSTYGLLTLEKAANSVTETYDRSRWKSAATEEFAPVLERLTELHPFDNPRFGWNDIGNGNLFADYYKDIARYVPERKLWYIYSGSIWQADTGNLQTMELCKRLANDLMMYALRVEDEHRRNEYIKIIGKWQVRRNREIIIKDAAGVHPVSMKEFDRDPYLFNCQNGTLDLQTREFREHRALDMLSKISGVKYDTAAHSERWEKFIREVMSDDKDKAMFLQKALGLALSGDTRYEALFILFGPSARNGKGCMMETMLRLMGDYGLTARPETIGLKQSNNSATPSEDVARLAGARFVNISEPDKHLTLNAALVKSMVGNDTLNARYLHENSFDFKPMFKLFINCNHLPTINDLTLFTSDRLKIIPFERHFEEHERDTGLKAFFAKAENLSGILNWCIEGFRLMEETGLSIPEAVRLATLAYQKNSDKIGLFIDDCLMPSQGAEVRTAAVYDEYRTWCNANGYRSESIKNFNAALSATITIERRRPRLGGGATTMITGYRLLTEFDRVMAV